mgnify:CR=1 FL=1
MSPPRRVHANGLLIEIGGHGPRLCLGGWEESLPPQCGDIPVVGLDWAKLEGETRTDDTVWGEFHVVGDFDGKVFTLTEPPGPPRPPPPADETIPCSPPGGRWERPNLKLATFDQVYATDAAARGLPGYAGLWMRDLQPQVGDVQDMTKVVLIVAFTGDAASHAAALRDDLAAMPPMRLAEVEKAQREVVEFALKLSSEGRVTLPGAGGERLV